MKLFLVGKGSVNLIYLNLYNSFMLDNFKIKIKKKKIRQSFINPRLHGRSVESLSEDWRPQSVVIVTQVAIGHRQADINTHKKNIVFPYVLRYDFPHAAVSAGSVIYYVLLCRY